jgi:hypothetical protein
MIREVAMRVVISSGHGKYVRGAEGPKPWGLDEVDEARHVVEVVADTLVEDGVEVTTFHDDTSRDQNTNLNTIVNFHNAQGPHDLDVSVHFNSAEFNGSNQTSNPVGTEVFYESSAGKEYAKDVVDAIAAAGHLINRGAKEGDLFFTSNTAEVAILIEVCFVNSSADAGLYREHFHDICDAIAKAIAGDEEVERPEPPGTRPPIEPPPSGALLHVVGRCSWFGGPNDTGVDTDEGLAFFYELEDAPHLFLSKQPPGTTGLARRLDPDTNYIACRWDYSAIPKDMLRDQTRKALVRAKGREVLCYPGDWGPHENTGRVCDLSPAAMSALDVSTDDEVEVIYPAPQEE